MRPLSCCRVAGIRQHQEEQGPPARRAKRRDRAETKLESSVDDLDDDGFSQIQEIDADGTSRLRGCSDRVDPVVCSKARPFSPLAESGEGIDGVGSREARLVSSFFQGLGGEKRRIGLYEWIGSHSDD